MSDAFPVFFLVSTPDGPVPLTAERGRLPLPSGPDGTDAPLYYAPYFEALHRFLRSDSFAPLLTALSGLLDRPVPLESVRKLRILSEKHGALYHVAHIEADVEDETCSLALNTASTPMQIALQEKETSLLQELHQRFGLPFLPRVFFSGEGLYRESAEDATRPLAMFLAEWFEGYREFHLAVDPAETSPPIKIWGLEEGDKILTSSQAESLYEEASFILTSYLDTDSFRQIYPWHHAAGDFVVREQGGKLEVRLITARGYQSATDIEPDSDEKWIPIMHFFLNLTIRMRLDRYEGTGDLAWAGEEAVRGTVSGFLRSWENKEESDPSLPPKEAVLVLFKQFSPEEWESFAELVLVDCMAEEEEIPFLHPRMKDHAETLSSILAGY